VPLVPLVLLVLPLVLVLGVEVRQRLPLAPLQRSQEQRRARH
jgi:hypothetical protein